MHDTILIILLLLIISLWQRNYLNNSDLYKYNELKLLLLLYI